MNACPATAILDDPRICTGKAWQATVLENPKQAELVSSMTELSQLAGQVKASQYGRESERGQGILSVWCHAHL